MQGTNDMTMARPASALRSPAALVGGAALVAALGLGGGWMLRGTSSPAPAAATPVATAPLAAPGQEPSNVAPVYSPEGPGGGAARLAPPETPAA
jgi:hypothetical protein